MHASAQEASAPPSAAQSARAWAAAFPDVWAGFVSPCAQAMSSAQAVTWAQQFKPRHLSHAFVAPMSLQNVFGSGWQTPASSGASQMQGSPSAQSAGPEHVWKQAPPPSMAEAPPSAAAGRGTQMPCAPHSALLTQAAEQRPAAP